MAAARCAARRLGGSLLQRAQAAATSPAVAEKQRRLMPRRFYSDDKGNAATGRFYEEYPKSKIQQQKEELYNLISEADKQFLGETKNRRLLQCLSEHVEPRPHDLEWRQLSRTVQTGRWLFRGGIASWILATFIIGWDVVEFAGEKEPSVSGEAQVEQQEYAASWDGAAVAQLKNAAVSDEVPQE